MRSRSPWMTSAGIARPARSARRSRSLRMAASCRPESSAEARPIARRTATRTSSSSCAVRFLEPIRPKVATMPSIGSMAGSRRNSNIIRLATVPVGPSPGLPMIETRDRVRVPCRIATSWRSASPTTRRRRGRHPEPPARSTPRCPRPCQPGCRWRWPGGAEIRAQIRQNPGRAWIGQHRGCRSAPLAWPRPDEFGAEVIPPPDHLQVQSHDEDDGVFGVRFTAKMPVRRKS